MSYVSRKHREFVLKYRSFDDIKNELTNNDLPLVSTLHQNVQLAMLLSEDKKEDIKISLTVNNTRYCLNWYAKPNIFMLRKHSKKDLTFVSSVEYYSKKKKNINFIKHTSSPLLLEVTCISISMVTADLLLIQHLKDGVWKEKYQLVVKEETSYKNLCSEILLPV